MGLGKRMAQRADALGGPDRKRLELAKALAMKPRLLLLDEVMAGLNHVEIEEVIEDIKKVRDQGISILVIEHVMKAIKSLSDRVFVLHHGEKIVEGANRRRAERLASDRSLPGAEATMSERVAQGRRGSARDMAKCRCCAT